MSEPPVVHEYISREVLGVCEQHTGNVHTRLEIARYVWRPEIAEEVGYKSCIRLKREYLEPFQGRLGHESCGVPEEDWNALVEVIKKVQL